MFLTQLQMTFKFPLLVVSMILVLTTQAQVVNGYAKVTNVSGAILTLSVVDETADTFEDDEWVVIMQMQDDVINTTTNSIGFGDLSSIGSCGRFEVRQIDSHTETAGVPTSITLKNTPNFTYSTGANSSVQIITFREFGSPDYTTTANMEALAWDGDIGGVVAIAVEGTLTLEHSISATALGFRGGSRSNNFSGPICNAASVTRYRENNAQLGFKGEGIYKNTNALYNNGRAKILNGGGGGSHHNGGGAGGGNYETGGIGGNGWNNCTTNPSGGLGGISLSSEISTERVFMGGGGGGGQQNNTQSRNGGNGGGIVLIRAGEITTGACGGVSIEANGIGPLSSGTNDGGGGGGAGGSIVFWVDTWNITAPCPLTISANGGDGSSSLSGGSHAGGGGGSQGVIIFNDSEPTTNITSETINGDPGCGNTSNPCNSLAGSPTGVDNGGILIGPTNPLPIELVRFEANMQNHQVALNWTTKSERNNDLFIVQRSFDGIHWENIDYQDGAGNSTSEIHYLSWDHTPRLGLNYYRLKQIDFDGTSTLSKISLVEYLSETVQLYPNPAQSSMTLTFVDPAVNDATIEVRNSIGQTIPVNFQKLNQYQWLIDTENLPAGVYILTIIQPNLRETYRFVRS